MIDGETPEQPPQPAHRAPPPPPAPPPPSPAPPAPPSAPSPQLAETAHAESPPQAALPSALSPQLTETARGPSAQAPEPAETGPSAQQPPSSEPPRSEPPNSEPPRSELPEDALAGAHSPPPEPPDGLPRADSAVAVVGPRLVRRVVCGYELGWLPADWLQTWRRLDGLLAHSGLNVRATLAPLEDLPADTDILVVPPALRQAARVAAVPNTPILVTPASAAAGAFADLVGRLEAGAEFTAERTGS